MKKLPSTFHSRRRFIQHGLHGCGVAAGLPLFLRETDLAMAANTVTGATNGNSDRILVVVELAGGNCGLNTVVPFEQDEYYRARPTIAIRKNTALRLSDEFGFHPFLLGWEKLFKDGKLAVVHGCGYPNRSRSHFESMKFWHWASPNNPQPDGWLGRMSNELPLPEKGPMIVNLSDKLSGAVRGGQFPTVVFDDPDQFILESTGQQKAVFREVFKKKEESGNPSLELVRGIAGTAHESSDFIRNACAEYKTKRDYGFGKIGKSLPRIVAQIAKGSGTRIYYTAMRGFDTHGQQTGTQNVNCMNIGDALLAFQQDLEAIGRDGDVSVMVFSEFGRRVKENSSRGTDHGAAGPMFITGKHVKGGLYGTFPSLTDLSKGDLKMTTDFRSVYATMIKEWMGLDPAKSLLKADYPTLGMFA